MQEEKVKKDDRITGVIGSVILHASLLLLFLFLGLRSIQQEEEGILVNFGDGPTGFGASEPVYNMPTSVVSTPPSSSVPATTPPPQPTSTQPTPVREPVLTQNYEETARIAAEEKAKKEAAERREVERRQQQEIDRQKRIEEERIRAEEVERQRVIAEQNRIQREKESQAQQARDNANRAFSTTQGTGTSEGVAGGTGNQGHLTGDPNSTNRDGTGRGTSGNSFSLGNRSLSGTLPRPVENCNDAGVVVVAITVDRTGKVTAAEAQLGGSQNLTACLRQAATTAALKARFNNDPNAAAFQTGTITYRFGFSN